MPDDMLWGGRFEGSVHPAIREFTNSLPFDRRLVRHDLLASLAHARMLRETDILSRGDSDLVLSGLSEILREVEAGELEVAGPDEDVHAWIERTLVERVGEAGKRLHVARSRNDQTAIALRLYVRERLEDVLSGVAGLQRVLTGQAASHRKTFLPGYTHLQRGQPVSLAHHLLAHVAAFAVDAERLRTAHRLAGVSPLGAGALAGTSFPIDPARSAALLGLDRTFANSMHIVGDRDYVLDAAYACAMLSTHLSRWADEIVLWSTREFRFIELDDSVAQGSSIMPQKKNPEAAEILRGKCARTIGNVTALLALMKGLPLTFNSDFQEDKERLFDTLDTADWSLAAATVIARGVSYRTDVMEAALAGGMLTATELADYLVRRSVPFRTAHHQVGEAVRLAEGGGVELWDLDLETLNTCCPSAGDDVHSVLRPDAAVAAHDSPGGPAPGRVLEQLQEVDRAVAALESWLDGRADPPIRRAHLEGRLLDAVLA